MNSTRAQAYHRVARTLRDVGPSKLLPSEQTVIRAAADELLFATDPTEPAAASALFAVMDVARRLIDTERWLPESALRLAADVAGCAGLDIEPVAVAA